jgi:uncharacterized protein with FMN-binding domain
MSVFARGGLARRMAGLGGLLAGVGLVVAARTAVGQPGGQSPALDPARAPLPTQAPGPAASTPATPPAPGSTAPPSASSSASGATPTSAQPAGPHTVTGSVVDTPYGPVQVAVVFSHGRITDVRALRTPTDADRSIRLAALATPILRQEVLTAQSAQVDSVSGATYTSEGYAQSVQYAIDHS